MKALELPLAKDLTVMKLDGKTHVGIFDSGSGTLSKFVQTSDEAEYIEQLLRENYGTLTLSPGSSFSIHKMKPDSIIIYDHARAVAVQAENVAIDGLIADTFVKLLGKS